MKNVKRVLSLLLVLCMVLAFFGCDSKENATAETGTVPTSETKSETETEPIVDPGPSLPENMNPLTGLACDASLTGQRPIGVMFNNIKTALPQIGLSKCDIIYEVLAEGGITRFEGLIFDYANAGKLGSVRSSRPYYVNIARAYDALYIHAGGSEAAYYLMATTGIDHFDGVRGNFYVGGELLFWRDQARLNSGYAMEHTMFVNGEDIAAAVQQKNIRSQAKNADFTAFRFDPAFTSIGSGQSATYIKIPHSTYYVSEFSYEADTGLYAHTHYGTKHIDGGTGEQIKATNLLILFVHEEKVDSYGRLGVTLTGEGKGYYANGGEYTAITWKRAADDAPFQYFNADGTELKVKQGKSYIALVDTATESSVTIS